MTTSPSEDELSDIQEQVEREIDEAATEIEKATAAGEAKRAEPYPPESLKPQAAEEEDDEFALPSQTQTKTEYAATDPDRMTADELREQGKDPFESFPPQRIMHAELLKAMLHAKLVITHTFEHDKTPAGEAILKILKVEKTELYAELVVRCGITLFIGWQKGMGLH